MGDNVAASAPVRPVRIGVQIQPQHASYTAIRDAVRRVEDAGADVVFNWDHFFPLYGEPEGAHFECWTMLAAWAEQTSRIELGALVTCNSYRNPELLADMARTVDHISNGRLIVGIGSGWFERDYTEYGYDFGTVGSRLDALATALPRMTDRWAQLDPPPTRELPILIGGGGETKTLRMVAQHAHLWHSFADPAVLAHKLTVLDHHCADVGRNRHEIEISVNVAQLAENDPSIAGTPLYDLGATLFTTGVAGPDYDLTGLDRWLQWRDHINEARE